MDEKVKIYKLSETDKLLNKLWWLRSTLSETKNARYSTMLEIQALSSDFDIQWVNIPAFERIFKRPLSLFSDYDELMVTNLREFLAAVSKIDGLNVAEDSSGGSFIINGNRLVRLSELDQSFKRNWFSLVSLNVQYLLGAGYHELSMKVFKRRLKNAAVKRFYRLYKQSWFWSKSGKNDLVCLNFSDFKKLKLVHLSPLHQLVRQKSIDFVSEQGTLITVEDYLQYYSDINKLDDKYMLLASDSTKFTNEKSPFEYPNWFNLNFWNSFNGHYFMNIFLGFRKGVLGYAYLDRTFFSEYVDVEMHSKKEYLRDGDIRNLVQGGDILIDGDVVCSGRHRVLAMIGHIVKGEKYIEFKVRRYPFNL